MQFMWDFGKKGKCRGVTVLEIVVAMLIVTFCVTAIVNSYVVCARQADRVAYSLAAQSLALGRMDQVRAAKWDLLNTPAIDEVVSTNFNPKFETLDLPLQNKTVYATNYTYISYVMTNPPLKKIQVDCVYVWMNGKYMTNTIITYRGPDQK